MLGMGPISSALGCCMVSALVRANYKARLQGHACVLHAAEAGSQLGYLGVV